MVEQIVVPTSNDIIVHIPDDYLGFPVRVRIDKEISPTISEAEHQHRKELLTEALKHSMVDMTGFKFDRDDANNYE